MEKQIARDLLALCQGLANELAALKQRQAAMQGVTAAALFALIRSHPDADSLRSEWDQSMSEFWGGAGAAQMGQKDAAQALQALLESALPPR